MPSSACLAIQPFCLDLHWYAVHAIKSRIYQVQSERQNQALECRNGLQGLEKHGVGRWKEVSAELLPRWDDQTLRVKASKLLGSQSLARYVGWKGDRWATILHMMLAPALYNQDRLYPLPWL